MTAIRDADPVWLRCPLGTLRVYGRSGRAYEPDIGRLIDAAEEDADALLAAHRDFEVVGRTTERDRRIRAQIAELLARAVNRGG